MDCTIEQPDCIFQLRMGRLCFCKGRNTVFSLHDIDSYHRADSHLSVSFLDASFYCFKKESAFSLKWLKFRLLRVIPHSFFIFFP